MTQETFAKGECQCGNIKYTVTGNPALSAQCHCTDCQKASGTGHMSNAFFREDDVIISGNFGEYTVTSDAGNQLVRRFCPTCGNRAHGTNSGRPGMVNIPVGIFEDNSWFSPQVVVYTKNRHAWDITSTEVPNFERMPPPK